MNLALKTQKTVEDLGTKEWLSARLAWYGEIVIGGKAQESEGNCLAWWKHKAHTEEKMLRSLCKDHECQGKGFGLFY